MRTLFLILLIFNIALLSQSRNFLSPHPVEKGTRFIFSSSTLKSADVKELKNIRPEEIRSISVAGSFNNWIKNQYFMTFDTLNKIWYVDIPLKEGVEYHYKFVINDSIWVTDPNAPDVTEDEWRNGIIIPTGFGKPYVINVTPPNGKRITKLYDFTCQLISPYAKIDKHSIECFLDGRKISHAFYEKKNFLRIKLPKNLEEGEHKVLIKFSDKNGNRNDGFLTKFFLDRYKAKIVTPEFYDSAIVYEIFVRTFFDSDDDGIGDLRGVKEKLDYLKNLGVNVIWFMPINESSKEHGYNVIDYYSIEKDYGTFEDYLDVLRECKRKNIRVIKDIVINHCDTAFVYFRDARNNPSSKYSNWFQFTDSMNSKWKHFGIEIDMPKFNFENEEVQNYFIDFVKFWMDPNKDGNFDDGIDGIRCDAAKEIPHSFWSRLRKEVKKIRQDFLILGEVWDGINYLIPFFEDEFDMLFDYPIYYAFQKFFDGIDLDAIKKTLIQQKRSYPANFQMLRFLSNHDNHRALSLFDEDTLKYFKSMVLLFTLPGTPMIYYGDEIGLKGKTPPENVRQKMTWNDHERNLIFNLYKTLIKLRKNYKSLSRPFNSKSNSLEFISTNYQEVHAYVRKYKKENVLVILNLSSKEISNIKLLINKKIKSTNLIFALSEFLMNQKCSQKINLNNLSIKPDEVLILKLDY